MSADLVFALVKEVAQVVVVEDIVVDEQEESPHHC